jgi:hypothetical protein
MRWPARPRRPETARLKSIPGQVPAKGQTAPSAPREVASQVHNLFPRQIQSIRSERPPLVFRSTLVRTGQCSEMMEGSGCRIYRSTESPASNSQFWRVRSPAPCSSIIPPHGFLRGSRLRQTRSIVLAQRSSLPGGMLTLGVHRPRGLIQTSPDQDVDCHAELLCG